jgi:hypothetical protein
MSPAKGNRVKVSSLVREAPSSLRRFVLAIALAMALALGGSLSAAHAITRPAVLKRANHWIKRRVGYSQHAYYGGYRRDCSGFVSMAWKLKRSYTSSTIRRETRRISWRALRPGDAVRRRGHVEIFGGWKNERHRRYWALEEEGRGKPALRRVKQFKRGYSALRYRRIEEAAPKKRVKTPARPRPVIVPPVPPSIDATSPLVPSIEATSPVPTETAGVLTLLL